MADLIIMPKLGFDMAEGILIRWVKEEGEAVEKGDLIAEIETDKATVEIESAYAGVVRKHLVKVDSIVPVNHSIAVIGGKDEEIDFDSLVGSEEFNQSSENKSAESKAEELTVSNKKPIDEARENGQYPAGVKISPLARKMANQNGIELSKLSGTGPGGRIVKKDIENYISNPPVEVATSETAATSGVGLPVGVNFVSGDVPADKQVAVTKLRQIIGKRMVQSKMEYPSFYVTNEMDMAATMKLRKETNQMLADSGEKLSVNDYIVKATALALRNFPNLNATLSDQTVTQYGHINIGIAVSVENGLLTVVVPDADQKSIRQISKEVKEKAGRVRSGKVNPNDISGSTFSISNLGMYNVHNFVAIINPPEAAILAVGSAYQTPVVENNEVVPGWRMQATISVDHRVSDGAEAAKFLQSLAYFIENPISLML